MIYPMEVVEELARTNGWRSASMAEYYENTDVMHYIPDDEKIDIPSYAEECPDNYRASWKQGWEEYGDDTQDDESEEIDDSDSWPYADDPRDN